MATAAERSPPSYLEEHMDAMHYGRIASAGWIFIGVLLSVFWASDAPQWHQLLSMVATTTSQPVAGVLAAAASLAGPPVFGFFVERAVTLLLRPLGWDMWAYPCNEHIHAMAQPKLDVALPTGTGVLHAIFYTTADSRIVDWVRRRTTQIYSSLAALVSMLLALAVAGFVFRSHAALVTATVLVLGALLLAYCRYVNTAVSACMAVWVNIYGRQHIETNIVFRSRELGAQGAPK